MNTPLRKVAIGVMVMIVALMGNATYVQVIKADQLRSDPRNSRVLLDEFSRERGQITTTDGQILAISVPSNDRFKFQREYPLDPDAFAPVTGFYSIQYGSTGLERAEDGILAGSDNRLFGRRFIDMLQGRDPKGGNVVTTINPLMQQVAYEQLTSRGYTGSVVALEPSTGKILAMVSTPSFDPSALASHNSSETTAAWDELANDTSKPLANRAINELYPPGSTFKIVTAAAALENGTTPESQVTGAAEIALPGSSTTLPNYGNQPCGNGKSVTLTYAFQHSCNTAFAELSLDIGEDSFRDKAEEFGVGDSAPDIPLTVADSRLGDIDDDAALMQSSIGQKDVAITPLEGAVMAATVANGGVRMRPQLVAGLQGPDRSNVFVMEPESMGEAMSPTIAQQITQMMIASEQYSGIGNVGVQVASKTGTADPYTGPDDPPFCWYVAFAPARNPTIAIAVMVENGGNGNPGAIGATVAGPIGHAVLRAGLQGQ